MRSLLIVLAFASPALYAQPFQPLGFFSADSPQSQAFGVSDDGRVVVGRSENAEGISTAFRWTAEDGLVNLLADVTGDDVTGTAMGASADGSVLVGSFAPNGQGALPFRWTEATGVVALELSSWEDGNATGLSVDGSVVVGIGIPDGGFGEALRWENGVALGLGDLPGGDDYSVAWGISGDGAVVVGQASGVDGSEAFRWTESSGMQSLGYLPEPGEFPYSFALGVSTDGSAIVGQSRSQNGAEAFRWTESGGMEGLGDLAGGGFNSSAYDASADGSVVVGTGRNDGGGAAFIWKAEDGMRSLQSVLETEFGVDLTGWTLTEARAVSNDGLVVVGRGINPDGDEEAWRADLAPSLSLTVRNSTRFGNPASPLEGVTVTLTGASGDLGSVVTTADGRADLESLSLDLSQPYDIRLEYEDLVRTYAGLVPDNLADTTLVLPVELADALGAQLAALDSTNTLVLGYDTDAALGLAAEVFSNAQPETTEGLRARDRALARLYTAAHNLREVYAATEPLAAETANVTVDAVLAFVAVRKAFQSVQETLDADFNENAWALQFIIESINVLFASTADAWKQAVSLALPDTAAGWFLQGEQLAWSIATAQTENLDWRDADRVNALFTQLGTIVVKEVGRVVIASGHVAATDGDLELAVERASDLEGTGSVRDGWVASGTATIETTDRIETTKNASDAFRSTFSGWNNVAGFARVIGTIPGAQVFLALGNALLVLDTGGLAIVTIVDFAEHYAVAETDTPRITDLAFSPAASQRAGLWMVPSQAASRRAAHTQQRSEATEAYLAQLAAIVGAVDAGDRTLALAEMEAFLEDEEALALALQTSTLAVQALAEPALARDAAEEAGLNGSPFLAAYGETIGSGTALAAERAMLYASIAAYAVPELAQPPQGSSTLPLAAADSVLAIAGRMEGALGAMNAALDAALDAAGGLVAPATVLVPEHGLVGTAGPLDLGALGWVAPGETLPLVAEVVNAGDEAAETVTARLVLDGDTLGAASALQLVGDAEVGLGTLSPGEVRTLTWSVATQDTSSTGQESVARYEIALSATSGRAQSTTGIVRVASTVPVEGDGSAEASAGEESRLHVFPNPTRGALAIRFGVSEVGPVQIALHDVLGRRVAMPIDQVLESGTHMAEFDASRLASGTYTVHMRVGEKVHVRKLTVMR